MIHFDLASRQNRIDEIDRLQLADGFWNDTRKAQALIQEANSQKELIRNFNKLTKEMNDISDSLDMLKEEFDEDMFALVESEFTDVMKEYEDFEIQVLLSHPYDQYNAILVLAVLRAWTGQ